MLRLLIFAMSLGFLAACHKHEVGNKYLEAKHHPSEKISDDSKKATKKVQRKFIKTQKKNNKAIGKKGNIWTKKKKQYTN